MNNPDLTQQLADALERAVPYDTKQKPDGHTKACGCVQCEVVSAMTAYRAQGEAKWRDDDFMARLAYIIEDRAKECGISGEKNAEPMATVFVVTGIVLSDLAKRLKAESLRPITEGRV